MEDSLPQQIESASVTLNLVGIEFGPHSVTFSVPKDHPAILELWKWHTEVMIKSMQASGPGDLFKF